MQWLKQNSSGTLSLGPFIDSSASVRSSLTISQSDVRLSKNSGAFSQIASTATASHQENGVYEKSYATADTDTLGRLKVLVNESPALIWWETYMVVPGNVYDSMFGTDRLEVDVVSWSGSSASVSNLAIKSTLAKTTDITGFNDLSAAAVNAEVDTALSDISLHKLIANEGTATDVANNSFLSRIVSSSATASFATFNHTTDSLEAIRDHIGNGSNLTEAGGTGDQFSAIPWNSSWDAEVQSECTDALNAYDPPTNAEMVARTLAAADYFDPAADGVIVTTNNDKTGYSLSADIRIKKNTALANFTFLMVDETDFATPETGLTITAERSIDGAALASCANSATEISNGLYKIDLAASDLNGDVVCLRFTATGAADRLITIVTQTE